LYKILKTFRSGLKDTNNLISIKEKVKNDTKIELPNFISIDENTNSGVGDYSKSFLIKFDSTNFDILIERIEYSIQHDSITQEINILEKEIKKMNWEVYESGYRIENYYPKSNISENYYVNINKQTLYYLYVEE
jgi:hypothetical protein